MLNSNLHFLLFGIDEIEQQARLRELRIATALYCGWTRAAKLALDAAIGDPAMIGTALAMVDALPARLRRQLLAAFGAVAFAKTNPARRRRYSSPSL